MTNNYNNDKSFIRIFHQKISFLRAFIYIFVAIFFLGTSLMIYWVKSPYTYREAPDTFYSKPPQTLKSFLYTSPNGGKYKVGDEFELNILVNTAGSNVVATAAYLSFNKNAMEVLSIDTSKSAFSMEAENIFDNEQGKIKITRGQPTPGVKGNSVYLATIKFKAVGLVNPILENLNFDFTEGSSIYSTVIVDDKKGTNILNNVRGAKILIN